MMIYEDVMICIRNPPYVDSELSNEYINDVLIPYVKCVEEKYEVEEYVAILLMDSFGAHCNVDIIKVLGENKIIVLCFSSHTTNIFQALDLSLFGVFKKIKNTVEDEESQEMVENAIIVILMAYEQTTTSFDIRGAFRYAGISTKTVAGKRVVEFVAKELLSNTGFHELWDFNIKIDEVKKKRQHKFGIVNSEYRPPGCTLISNETPKYENENEINRLLQ